MMEILYNSLGGATTVTFKSQAPELAELIIANLRLDELGESGTNSTIATGSVGNVDLFNDNVIVDMSY
jgi:hypothetical protein